MIHHAISVVATTDARLVILSIFVALAGACSTLDMLDQTNVSPRATHGWWLTGSGLTLGLTIWAMHFTAILSHRLSIPVGFDFLKVFLSFGIALFGSTIGILIASYPILARWIWTLIGSSVVGVTIMGMHFVAMNALQLAADPSYDLKLVVLSGAIAIGAAFGTFGLVLHRRLELQDWLRRLIGTSLLGMAICGMHFTAMAALSYHTVSSSPSMPMIDSSVLAIVISVAVLLLLTLTQLSAFIGRRLTFEYALAETRQQNEARLEQLVQQRTQELEDAIHLADAANQTKTTFLANMSHELRTPLTSIMGFSSVLNQQIFGALNPKQQQYVVIIYQASQTLLELINDLLDLAKIEAGKAELVRESVDVAELCEACLGLVRETTEQKGLELKLEIAPQAQTCQADPRRLRQILINLLSNAVKFTTIGSISLRVDRASNELEFKVSDTGIGISEADQAKLFQPFQQLDSGLDRRYAGTGLGLALSQDLARLHGGIITVESQPGQGSCFTLHLPDEPQQSE